MKSAEFQGWLRGQADYAKAELAQIPGRAALRERLGQLADAGDEVNNATVIWPDTRRVVELGTLTIRTVDADGKTFEKNNMFNPLVLVDGIEPSADPILLARPSAYAVSYGRRLSGQ